MISAEFYFTAKDGVEAAYQRTGEYLAVRCDDEAAEFRIQRTYICVLLLTDGGVTVGASDHVEPAVAMLQAKQEAYNQAQSRAFRAQYWTNRVECAKEEERLRGDIL